MDIIKPDTTQEEPREDIRPIEGPVENRDVNYLSLKGFFNVENPSIEEQEAMNFIYDKFEKAGARSMSDILLALKDMQMRIGITPLGESRIIALKNYIKINSQIDELIKIKQSYER